MLIFSPIAWFLVPFAIMTVGAVKLGGRFSMFGGIDLGLGAFFLIIWGVSKVGISGFVQKYLKAFSAIVLSCMLLVGVGRIIVDASATPIMGAAHVSALIKAGKATPKDSTFWTWWDWGYATMYYAERHSFADGGHHGGKVLFPLAFSYATPSSLQSSQMIKYSAANAYNPAKVWDKMSADEVAGELSLLGSSKLKFPKIPNQYLVVSWDDVRLAYWILYYGSWNLKNSGGVHPSISAITRSFDFKADSGVMTISGERPFNVSGYDVLSSKQSTSRRYSGVFGPNLIYNAEVRQAFVLDDFAYGSTLFKLLISNPDDPEVKACFRLVYDGFPMVRVYEVF